MSQLFRFTGGHNGPIIINDSITGGLVSHASDHATSLYFPASLILLLLPLRSPSPLMPRSSALFQSFHPQLPLQTSITSWSPPLPAAPHHWFLRFNILQNDLSFRLHNFGWPKLISTVSAVDLLLSCHSYAQRKAVWIPWPYISFHFHCAKKELGAKRTKETPPPHPTPSFTRRHNCAHSHTHVDESSDFTKVQSTISHN